MDSMQTILASPPSRDSSGSQTGTGSIGLKTNCDASERVKGKSEWAANMGPISLPEWPFSQQELGKVWENLKKDC